jgi:hypothetical protein
VRKSIAAVATLLLSSAALLGSQTTKSPAVAGDPVIFAVGDMACDPLDTGFNGGAGTATNCAEQRVSTAMMSDPLFSQVTPATPILGLGDYQYECGIDYQDSYTPTWGRLNAEISPVAGNHEYQTGPDLWNQTCPATNSTAQTYFNYFAPYNAHQSSGGHYFFDVGSWHIIALNAQCGHTGVGGCGATSPQTKWLKADLASADAQAHPCILAYWHQPLFTGIGTGKQLTYQPWWNALYAAHADVVLNGHIHNYQRFAPMDPSGNSDPATGITEYIVGTGGEKQVSVKSGVVPKPAFNSKTFGYLRMTLGVDGWTSDFVSVDSSGISTPLDHYSSGTCHL